MPAAIQQYFDTSGNPLSGGSLTFYAAGTTTPQTVYSDSTLTTPLSNPLTLDSAGRTSTPVFLSGSASYKILLKTSGGSTIWTADNMAGGTYLAQQAAMPVVQTTTSTGAQNDFDLTCTTSSSVCLLRANNATDLTVTGFEAMGSGTRLVIVAVGAGNVFLASQNTSSAAANRMINFVVSSTTPLAAGVGRAEYVYDATALRWRMVSHEQGGWITPTFAAGDYTAATGTWTVGAGDVSTYRYYLSGRQLTIEFDLQTTDVSAAPATLRMTAPNTFTLASNAVFSLIRVSNAGAAAAVGLAQSVGTAVYFYSTLAGGAWGVAAASTVVGGVLTLEVI